MAKKFPKTLFVRVKEDGGTDWFQSDENVVSLVEMGERVKIARYELKETITAESMVKLT